MQGEIQCDNFMRRLVSFNMSGVSTYPIIYRTSRVDCKTTVHQISQQEIKQLIYLKRLDAVLGAYVCPPKK